MKYIIDRFEGDMAILETENRETFSVPKKMRKALKKPMKKRQRKRIKTISLKGFKKSVALRVL